MPNLSIPGVYIEEISKFPPSVAQVPTAIPAFIGYTEKAIDANSKPLPSNSPFRIGSLKDFEKHFGYAKPPQVSRINLDGNNNFVSAIIATNYYLYDAVRLFYLNGGGDCYIVSLASGFSPIQKSDFSLALIEIGKVDEPTILLFPDAVGLTVDQLGTIQDESLSQCGTLKDRITICDLKNEANYLEFRNEIGNKDLKYGMAYTPWLDISPPKNITYAQLNGPNLIFIDNAVTGTSLFTLSNLAIKAILTAYTAELGNTNPDPILLADYEAQLIDSFGLYKSILAGINATIFKIPPSGAVAGIMAYVDRTRGVWKAPANVSLSGVIKPSHFFSQTELEALNIDVNAGKSINAIRSFSGKGTLIWGARTLAGNDNEWRYVPVRRFFNMVEESVKKACEQFVFEPNDANTWTRVQGMIENFLFQQWRDGALQGIKPEHAFFVAVGLGKTMTAQDILEGRMILEIGMAPVRPAEFIILKFSQKMAES